MRKARWTWCGSLALAGLGVLLALGCHNTPIDVSEYVRGPAPLRMPSPAAAQHCDCYEDSLTGGQVFAMYCGYCHTAPALAERPFASYRNVAAHMRVRANLTGKEYAKLMEFLRRWHDIPSPHPPVEPSPKRFIYSQPIPELKSEAKAGGTAPKPPEPLPPPQSKPGDNSKQPKGEE